MNKVIHAKILGVSVVCIAAVIAAYQVGKRYGK